MKDMQSITKLSTALVPAVRTADATGLTIDRQGYNSLTFAIMVGVGGITFDATNKIEFIMEESDDDSTWTACADAAILGVDGTSSGIVKALVAEHAAAAVYSYGYRGAKRYARIKQDHSGTHGTGTPTAVVAVLGEPDHTPVA